MAGKDDHVTLRLIFVNYNSTREMTANVSLHVKDLKRLILDSHLPDNFTPHNEIDHIRLLNAGRELDDSKSIGEAHIQIPGGSVIPVHVVTVLKSALSGSNRVGSDGLGLRKGKESSCWCIIC
jgi:Ubiquitin-2 like Rad60 SUMO-like